MVDDMGYSDIGCYGGEVKTPNIDRLAKGGLRFTNFYNNAKCGPTRASILTGQYSQAVSESTLKYGATFGEVLKTKGYRTICSGKWHQSCVPVERGFDRYYGLKDGCCNFFNPGVVAREGEGLPGRKKKGTRRWMIEDKVIDGYTNPDKKFYTTDAFASYAIDRLEEYKGEDKPFLLYMPFTAPHYPLHAWPADIAKYRGKFKMGWDKLRQQRYKRMIEMGIIEKKFDLSPRDESAREWNSLSAKEKDDEDLKMAVYCAMIDRVDQNLGRVFKKLKKLGEWDNTLILFLSDNGGCPEQPNTTPNIPPGPVESYRTVSVGWANASNTPYRKFKSTDYEGGACTPFIAHWPGVIEAGVITDQVGHIIDINPTFGDIAGASYPETIKGVKTKPVAGKSLLPIFQGKVRVPHDEVYWQYRYTKAVRQGDWKLIRYKEDDWELYDMKEDKTELRNLAAKQPEKTKELTALWETWYKEVKQ